MLADQAIRCGDAEVVVAGGQESMSNTPFFVPGVRNGIKMGNAQFTDSMIHDGLWDVYNNFHMGNAAELCASECAIPRESQDAFAIDSYKKAQEAQKNGGFAAEIVPVTVRGKKGDVVIGEDEGPGKANFEKMPSLKPVFQKDGTVTAANASSINDGAAAVVLASAAKAEELGVKPLARIVAHASFAQKPEWFTTAPIGGIQRALDKAGLSIEDIDLFEINEAFAVVGLATQDKLGIPAEKINVHGGAIALGHPIGASGARILATLVHALRRHNKRYGLATLCIGGGEASALIVEAIY
jgi:acetyl-CoA C-acetyltransferase